ncbi:hypothetical protein TI39_contig5889g00001 [Zymoseptoria brevis]|uniref:Uncharacterized protein n=1 Tax=Zymoseptoria brevis TaxID=1047168 RepID=A0A0F4G4E6_9PEZI|nr:hypothetical protein TI39_contig5889g00001 [Zymoseptoria brevis]
MAGVHGQVLGHLVRRGVSHFSGSNDAYVQQLQQDATATATATLYDTKADADVDWEVRSYEMIPIIITAFITLLVVAAIRYSIGHVIAALTMIESPSHIAIISDKPPAYADSPDAPLEKEPLMPSEAEADVEVMLVNSKPITSKISTTMAHLYKIDGFRGKFRGARVSVMYHLLHSVVSNFLIVVFDAGLVGNSLIYIFVSLGLARVHMAWTHAMIATDSPVSFWRSMPARKQCKAILLPTLVVALAEQATIIFPIIVAFAVGLPDMQSDHVVKAAQDGEGCQMGLIALRLLAVPATLIFVAVAILLPANVTLTRIEAALLPEDRNTIVPFDREALVGDLDLTACGSSKALFVEAWRSFDSAARWRLIKLYVKMVAIELSVVFVAAHVMVAEMYIIGGEKIALLAKSMSAQAKLAGIEAQEVAN